jgi:hypothetical protein
MRFAFLFLAGGTGLYATSVASVTCTLGPVSETFTANTSTMCQLFYPAPGDLFVAANADLAPLNVGATAGITPGIPGSANPSASASASETEFFRTAGLPRLGGIQYWFTGSGYGNVLLSDGSYQYSLNCGGLRSCSSWDGPGPPPVLPFELGINFEVSLTAAASGCELDCAQPSAAVSFLQFFEADGTTPVSYFPVTVPEPQTGCLLLFAIPAMLWKFRRRACARAASGGFCNGRRYSCR